MTPITAVDAGTHPSGVFGLLPRDPVFAIFLRLNFQDLQSAYSASLGNRHLCTLLTSSEPSCLKLYLERYFSTRYRRSCNVQRVDDAALCKELAIRKKNIRENQCTEFPLQRHFHSIDYSSIQENGFLAYSLEDGKLYAWDDEGQLLPSRLPFSPSPAFTSLQMDDEHLMLCSWDGILHIYRFEQSQLLPTIELEGKPQRLHNVHKRGNRIIASVDDGSVKLWNGSGALVKMLQEPGNLSPMRFYINENYIAQGLGGGIVHIWNHEGLPLKGIGEETVLKGKGGISYLLIREDLLFVGTTSGVFKIWNLEKHTLVRTILADENEGDIFYDWKVIDDYLIVTGGRTVKIWELVSDSDQPIQQFVYDEPIRSISMRESRLLVATTDKFIKILDFDPPSLLADLQIVTPKQYQEKLGCSAPFLSRVGLCCPADLRILAPFSFPMKDEVNQPFIPLLKAYLQQPDLLPLWERMKKGTGIHTLSTLLETFTRANPFRLAETFYPLIVVD
jgi:WD40 repeat protein